MELHIMRHGPAEDQAASGRDFDRVLTPSGREFTRRVVAELGRHAEAPHRVLSSPLVRARETAQIVVDELGVASSVELCDELAPGAAAEQLVRQLARSSVERVMLVGHEPDVSALALQLTGTFGRSFEKAMVVGLAVSAGVPALVRFVLDPKKLEFRRR